MRYLSKMKNTVILLFLLSGIISVDAQTITSSNLPLVVITTDINPSTGKAYTIVDEPKVPATMKIIYHRDGSRNFLSDQNTPDFINYSGKIGIEIRGSSSKELPKKPYGLTTVKTDGSNNNVSLLDMPRENDWILNSLAYDPSLMRDYLAYETYRLTHNYSPRGRYCELILNGSYQGLYLLMEKIKVDENRVDITKMTNTDIAGDDLTGGYITKSDKTTGNDPVAWRIGYTDFIHHSPTPESITPQQNSYIYNRFLALNTAASTKNNSVTSGIPSIIDIPSFIDFMLLNELFANVDGYQISTFFHKDRNGKLRAGPIWDFNLTLGNDLFQWGYDRSKTNTHQFEDGNTGAPFWKNLYYNATYKCYLAKRWSELSMAGAPLNYSELEKRMNQNAALLSEAVSREQSKWGTVSTHTANITAMKSWLKTRISWMNQQYGSYATCAAVAVPSLVISKINYNPQSTGYISSDSLEFIEITNTGTTVANLTGVYFRELGLTYQFPANTQLQPGKQLYLASNSRIFEMHYNKPAFAQFSRKLGNDSESLVLSDSWGNEIDRVDYSDSYPWPGEADGEGKYLELINLLADNNDAFNWQASDGIMSSTEHLMADLITLYPVPATTSVTVSSGNASIVSYTIVDLTGRLLLTGIPDSESRIRIENLKPDSYFIIFKMENGESITKKLLVGRQI